MIVSHREFMVLCETCGYPLEGLPAEGCCPECSTPVATSHPMSRTGTPWQGGAGLGPLWATWRRVLFQPQTVRIMAIDRYSAETMLVAAALTVFAPHAALFASL